MVLSKKEADILHDVWAAAHTIYYALEEIRPAHGFSEYVKNEDKPVIEPMKPLEGAGISSLLNLIGGKINEIIAHINKEGKDGDGK